MNDVYATMAAQKVLMCSREETEEFKRILAEEDARYERGEINDFFGFEVVHIEEEGALFYAPDMAYPECLPGVFLRKVAEVLTRLGEPYLEFGVSVTHEGGPEPDSEYGYQFRITDRGELVFAETVWPGKESTTGTLCDALDALVQMFGQDPREADKAQEALERLLEFWDVRQGDAIAALARYLQYRVERFSECAHCGADLSQEAVETEVGRFCSAHCAELEE